MWGVCAGSSDRWSAAVRGQTDGVPGCGCQCRRAAGVPPAVGADGGGLHGARLEGREAERGSPKHRRGGIEGKRCRAGSLRAARSERAQFHRQRGGPRRPARWSGYHRDGRVHGQCGREDDGGHGGPDNERAAECDHESAVVCSGGARVDACVLSPSEEVRLSRVRCRAALGRERASVYRPRAE